MTGWLAASGAPACRSRKPLTRRVQVSVASRSRECSRMAEERVLDQQPPDPPADSEHPRGPLGIQEVVDVSRQDAPSRHLGDRRAEVPHPVFPGANLLHFPALPVVTRANTTFHGHSCHDPGSPTRVPWSPGSPPTPSPKD